ncbi:MAG: type II toxin-antitoxin system RelE/ParE family toxin [Dehalococcoidia bacterium]
MARDSPAAAAAIVRRIRNEGRRLARYPEIGRIVPEYNDVSYREVIVVPYRVIYRYFRDQDIVRVLTVVHGSRLLPPFRG